MTSMESDGQGSLQTAARAVRKAQRQAKRGQLVEAIHSLEHAMRLGADPYDCYLHQAYLYMGLGLSIEAVSAAEKAIAQRPDRLSAREAVVDLLIEAQDYEGAILAGQAILRMDPKHMAARDALGKAFVALGDIPAAIRVANDLIRLDPRDPTHRFRKALLCQQEGEFGVAIQELERAINVSDDQVISRAARELLDALDTAQLRRVRLLAAEDPIFCAKVIREPALAIVERGFALSDWGMRRLEAIASDELSAYHVDVRPRMYH